MREPGYGNSAAGFGARSSYGWRRARLWGLIASLAAACGEAPPGSTPLGEAGKLSPIQSGEIRYLELDLEAGHFLHLEVEQHGIDLSLELKSPEGEPITKIDSPNGAWGLEDLILLVPATGRHRLEVHGPQELGISGQVAWRLVAQRPPTSWDCDLAAAEGVLRRGHAERNAGRLAEAASSYREAWEGFSRPALPRRQAEVLQGLYRVQDLAEARELAASLAEKAAAMFEEAGEARLAATMRRSAGQQWLQLGQPAPAIEQLERAHEFFREAADSNELALTLGKLAAAHSQSGRLQVAWSTYERAFESLGEAGDAEIEASLLTDYVPLLQDLGQHQRAISAGERAVALFRPASRVEQLAPALWVLASARSEAGQQSAAEPAITEALALARSSRAPRLLANALLQAGLVWWRGGDSPRAEAALAEAVALAREAGDAKAEAEVRLALGALLTSTGQAEQALAHHDEAEGLFRTVGDVKGLTSTAARGAEALLSLGRPFEAWKRMEPALEQVERLRLSTRRRDHRAGFFALRQDYFGIALDILLSCHEAEPRRGYDLLAWQVHERRLARELADVRRENRVAAATPLVARERELVASLSATALEPDAAIRVPRVEALLTELEQVRARAAPLAEVPRIEPKAELARVRRDLLDRESLLLVVALGERRSLLWAITESDFETHSLPPRSEIEPLAHAWLGKLREPRRSGRAEQERLGHELSSRLLSPIAPQLGRWRLLIAADGALEGLAWAALPVPDESGEAVPLLDRHSITTLPSVQTLLERPERPSSALAEPRWAAVFSDPVFTSEDARLPAASRRASRPQDLPPVPGEQELERAVTALGLQALPRLPETGREGEAVLALLPGGQGRLSSGFEANRERFYSLPFDRLGVLHLATHALLDPSTPETSGIVLSRFDSQGRPIPGYLAAAELARLRLPGTLVVLSACESGVGKQLPGEGMLSLMRAFFEAGADGVVASLWPVSDQRTARLMEHFYRGYLQAGLPVAEALRQAQLALAADSDSADAYYWAGFFYQGRPSVW